MRFHLLLTTFYKKNFLLFYFLMVSLSLHAQTFTVTNTNDSGPGSLREGIEQVNLGNYNKIGFDLNNSTGYTITPVSEYSEITEPVTINGLNSDSVNKITIDGTNVAGRCFVLHEYSNASNLIITNFSGTGIRIFGNSVLAYIDFLDNGGGVGASRDFNEVHHCVFSGSGLTVSSNGDTLNTTNGYYHHNYFGVDTSFKTLNKLGTAISVRTFVTDTSRPVSNNLFENNVIFNAQRGVFSLSSGVIFRENYVGILPDGTNGNIDNIGFELSVNNVLLEDNVICNCNWGVFFYYYLNSNNLIKRNYFGIDKEGNTPGNRDRNVFVASLIGTSYILDENVFYSKNNSSLISDAFTALEDDRSSFEPFTEFTRLTKNIFINESGGAFKSFEADVDFDAHSYTSDIISYEGFTDSLILIGTGNPTDTIEVFVGDGIPENTTAYINFTTVDQNGEWQLVIPSGEHYNPLLDNYYVTIASDSNRNSYELSPPFKVTIQEGICYVLNTNNNGPGSLRSALACADFNPGLDTIKVYIDDTNDLMLTPNEVLNAQGVYLDGSNSFPGSTNHLIFDGSNCVSDYGVVATQSELKNMEFTNFDQRAALLLNGNNKADSVDIHGNRSASAVELWNKDTLRFSKIYANQSSAVTGHTSSTSVGPSDILIYGNYIYDNANGVSLSNARGVIDIENNSIGLDEVGNVNGNSNHGINFSSLLDGGVVNVLDNVIVGNGKDGINMSLSSRVNITGNKIGITQDSVVSPNGNLGINGNSSVIGNIMVSGNEIYADSSSIYLRFISGNQGNIISDNHVYSAHKEGIIIESGEKNQVENNFIIRAGGGTGISISGSNEISVTGNIIQDTDSTALSIENSSLININNNIIGQDENYAIGGHGIFINSCYSSTLSNNVIANTSLDGLYSFSSSGNTLDSTIIYSCDHNGIILENSSGNTISNFRLGQNLNGQILPVDSSGIKVINSYGNVIKNTSVANVFEGISFKDLSNGNKLTTSPIYNTKQKAINLRNQANNAKDTATISSHSIVTNKLTLSGSGIDNDTVEVFVNNGLPENAIAYVGNAFVTGGVWNLDIPEGEFYDPAKTNFYVTTATDQSGNTSELSMPYVVQGPCGVVSSLADSGPGSLRAAIECANNKLGPDTIVFNIIGNKEKIIPLTSPMAPITDTLVIQGDSQENGMIILDGTKIINEKRAFIFNHNFSKSVIDNIHFKNCPIAIGTLSDSDSLCINNCSFENCESAIEITYPSERINIFNNFISKSSGIYGVLLIHSLKGRVHSNTFISNENAITVNLSDSIEITENKFQNNIYSINVQSSEYITMTKNFIDSALTIPGILCSSMNHSCIDSNSIYGLNWGMFLGNSLSNKIRYNKICPNNLTKQSSMEGGIHITNGTENLIEMNRIIHNNIGVNLQNSYKNRIKNNFFLNNKNTAIDLNLLSTNPSNNSKDTATITTYNLTPTTLTLSGTSAPEDSVEIFINDGTPQNALEYVGTAKTDALGNWAIDLNRTDVFVDGNLNYYVTTATDMNGNTSELSDPFVVFPESCVVTNTNIEGIGSFYNALECAYEKPGGDTIYFDILGNGDHIFEAHGYYPTVQPDPLVIDGSTQPAGEIIFDGQGLSYFMALATQKNVGLVGIGIKNYQTGIYIGRCENCFLIDCKIQNTNVAINTIGYPNPNAITNKGFILENTHIDSTRNKPLVLDSRTSGAHIVNNTITNTGGNYTIQIIDSDSNTIKENKLDNGDGLGIHLDGGSKLNLVENNAIYNFEGGGIGIYGQSQFNLITNNQIIENSQFGILINGNSNYNKIIENTIGEIEGKGILIESGSRYNGIEENYIGLNSNFDSLGINSHGIEVIPGNYSNTIIGNYIGYSQGDGINNSADSTIISDNYIGHDGYSTFANYGNGVTVQIPSTHTSISGNNVGGNTGHGLLITTSTNNSITDNNIENNELSGINLTSSSNFNDIIDNTIINNGNGIRVEFGSGFNNITMNTVNNNHNYGLTLSDGAGNNTIENNTVNQNGDLGLVMYNGSSNNAIFSNIFSEHDSSQISASSGSYYNKISENTFNKSLMRAIELYVLSGSPGNNAKDTATITAHNIAGNILTLSGTGLDNDTIEVFVNDGFAENALAYVGSAKVAGGSWSMNIPEGSSYDSNKDNYYVTTATDLAGNTSELSAPYLVPVDLCNVSSTNLMSDTLGVCKNDSVLLQSPVKNVLKSWYKNNTFLNMGDSIYAKTGGEYILELEDSYGCKTHDTIQVIENPLPLISDFLVSSYTGIEDELVIVNVSYTQPDSVVWDFGKAVAEDQGTYFILNFPETGTYEITLTAYLDYCSKSISKTVEVLEDYTSPSDNINAAFDFKTVQLYPNPTTGQFTADISLIEEKTVDITVFNAQSNVIEQTTLTGESEYTTSFDIEAQPPGNYFLRFTTDSDTRIIRLIKQ